MSVTVEGTNEFGEVLRATGKTRAAARRLLIRKIERQTGQRFETMHEGGIAEFAPVERFAELPPGGHYERICLKTRDGRIVCGKPTGKPTCQCLDKSRCSCGGHTNYSEEKPMRTASRRRLKRFDEGKGEDVRAKILEIVEGADEEKLQAIYGALMDTLGGGGDEEMDDEDLGGMGNGGQDFDETDPVTGLETSARDNLPKMSDKQRIKRYCEKEIFRGSPAKFAEKDATVERLFESYRKSGEPIHKFLPRGW